MSPAHVHWAVGSVVTASLGACAAGRNRSCGIALLGAVVSRSAATV